MKLTMLKTTSGSVDGVHLKNYMEGQEYEIGGTSRADELAQVFLRERWAVEASATAIVPPAIVPPAIVPPAEVPIAVVQLPDVKAARVDKKRVEVKK